MLKNLSTSLMKAIRIEKFGGPAVLQLQSVDVPALTDTTILVKLFAAGVNPVDTYIREGTYSKLPQLPFTPGKDGAGIVQKVGRNVTRFKVDQRVFVCRHGLDGCGTYAEYCTAEERDVFPLHDSISFPEGAAIGIPYFTAYRALVLKTKCTAGETVLIHGASGAVGLAAVQIAKNRGLRVIGSAGTPEGMSLVKSLGADHVICHKEKKYLEAILEITDNKGVDIILEMLANVNLDKDLDVLAPHGRIAIVGSRGSVKIDPRKMMAPELSILGISLFASTQDEWRETSEAIVEGIKQGWVKPVVHRTYPLDQADEAHTDIIHSSGARGNLVLTIQQEDQE